jgi:hypothetical protein
MIFALLTIAQDFENKKGVTENSRFAPVCANN